MKNRLSRRALAALATAALVLGLTQAAIGQQDAPDLSGAWRFKSGTFNSGCEMTGGMTLTPATVAGAYTCAMTVQTRCYQPGSGLYESWRVKQTCTATQTGQNVQITGAIARVEEARLDGRNLTGKALTTYVADNFELTIKPGADEMNGQIVKPLRRVSARVWREAEPAP